MNLAEPKEAPPAPKFIASNGLCINSFPKQTSAVSFCFLNKEAKEILSFLCGINHDSIFPFSLTSKAKEEAGEWANELLARCTSRAPRHVIL